MTSIMNLSMLICNIAVYCDTRRPQFYIENIAKFCWALIKIAAFLVFISFWFVFCCFSNEQPSIVNKTVKSIDQMTRD